MILIFCRLFVWLHIGFICGPNLLLVDQGELMAMGCYQLLTAQDLFF
jgi:hypothetical protein